MNDETKLTFAKAFWELRVYEKARDLQGGMFRASRAFPPEGKYSLTDQLRRAARSIGAQIAEAWGKRDYIKHFTARPLFQKSQEIGRMLNTMTNRAEEF